MEIKYRLHEVAKDLNVPNKEIIALMEKYFGETKKHMTALTDEELNVVFEHYVSQTGDSPEPGAYFATQNRPKKEEAKPQAKKASKTGQGGKCGKIQLKTAKPQAKAVKPSSSPKTGKITGPVQKENQLRVHSSKQVAKPGIINHRTATALMRPKRSP